MSRQTPVKAIAICKLSKKSSIPTETPIQTAITIAAPTFAAPAHQADKSFVNCSYTLRCSAVENEVIVPDGVMSKRSS